MPRQTATPSNSNCCRTEPRQLDRQLHSQLDRPLDYKTIRQVHARSCCCLLLLFVRCCCCHVFFAPCTQAMLLLIVAATQLVGFSGSTLGVVFGPLVFFCPLHMQNVVAAIAVIYLFFLPLAHARCCCCQFFCPLHMHAVAAVILFACVL